MKKTISYLLDWAYDYIKNKDLILRNIKDIEKKQDSLIIKNKDNKKDISLILPSLENLDSINKKTKDFEKITIITLNSKDNLETLISKWEELEKIQNLKIIFVNPFSELEKKWIISPYIHSKITEKTSLKTGLRSLSELVENIDIKKFEKKIS